ncbi:dentin sialophosphoprotein-like isoform X2 [Macadamia integrifolia]|uniref:dentin sialophosphoprotein-like isoform X2 n=1 Tax=Macadamia integrifolia TaxID=60698 RepID=UPI001C4FEA30|nr:dentin sialophosphoprotein-like isoform X2 [Macadamia integrifolia]
MAKGKGSDDGSGQYDSGSYRVFMDSNFDTHLLMIVSAQDTVRDLKEKIMIEHPRCFPNIGKISVNALKVKCEGCFYHLSDSMLVKSVFDGFMKTWILQFDASCQGEHKENPCHLEPGASDLPIHVVSMDGPLPETNTHLLDYPSKEVSILAVPSVPQIGSIQPRDIFPQNSSADKRKLKIADSEGLSTRLLEDDLLISQKSSDKQKPKNADSEGLNEDGPLLNYGGKSKKKEKKKKPSIPYDQVDYAILSGKNIREEETSMVALGNNHGNLEGEIGAALATEQTNAADSFVGLDISEPGTSKLERGNTSDHIEASRVRKSKGSKKHQPGSSDNNARDDASGDTFEVALEVNHENLGGETDAALAFGKIDAAGPFVDDDMLKLGTRNVVRRDTSDHIEASRGRKSKGTKKHHAASVKGVDLPVIVEPGMLLKDGKTLVYENVSCDNSVGKNVREETSEVAVRSKHGNSGGEFDAALSPEKTDAADPFVGIDMSKRGTSKAKRRNTSDLLDASGGRKLKRSKKHKDASVEGLKMPVVVEPGNLTKESTTLVHKNIRCDNSDGDDGTGKTEEKKTHLQNEDPEPTLSAAPNSKLKSMGLDKKEMNSKGGFISSNLLQSSDVSGTGDSVDKKRKKPKKYKDSDQKVQTSSSGIEYTNGVGGAIPLKPEVNKASFSDHLGDETNGEHDTLFRNEKATVSKVKTVNAPVTGLDKDADNACGNQVDLVPQIQVAKVQEPVEGNEYKVKKKSKKTETSARNLPDPTEKIQDAVTVDSALPFDKKKGKNVQTKNTKKTRLGKKDPTEQLMDSMSEAEKDIGSRIICSKPCPVPETNEPSEVPSDIFAHNTERLPHEADNREEKHSSIRIGKGSDIMEVPKFESARISYIDNFGPSQRQHEVAPGKELDIKDIPIERSDKELPSNKKTKKHNVNSLGNSPYLQKSLSSNDNQGFTEKPQGDPFDVVKVQAPMLKTKKVEARVDSHNRKTSTTAGDKEKGLPSCFCEKGDSIAHEASRIKVVDASGISSPVHSSVVGVPFRAGDNAYVKENSADWDASGFSSESTDVGVHKGIQGRELKSRVKSNPVVAVKASSKKIGEALNNSSHQKSLYATSGTIFNDSSSDSSEDESAINNSDTSTKSPSGYSSSSSSDYLEGANHTPRNALYGGKSKENGEGNLIYSQSCGPAEYITLDMILKCSRSYKKAKLTASQSQLEESQPIDFVLDSLADP